MRSILKHCWLVALRGILAVGLAYYAYTLRDRSEQGWIELITWPYVLLSLCAYGLLDGILLLLLSWRSRSGATRTFIALQGMTSIAVAVSVSTFVFARAKISWFVFFAVAQCWIIAMNEIATGLHLRRHLADKSSFFAAAVLSIMFGSAMLIVYDGSSRQAAIWLAWFGLGMAVTEFWIAWRIWSWYRATRPAIVSAA
jgi:hypothetical protein